MSQALNIDIVRKDKDLQPPLYAKRDIALVRGEGVYLWDADGTRYLDLVSNYGVNILGHAHPKVTEAIQRQAATLVSCHQSFSNDVRSAFLQKLLSIAPAGLTHAFLSNSGTEAIEAALKFAYVATGRTKVVAAKRGYHGRTLGALAATADKKYRDPFAGALAEATHVTYGDAEALAEAVDETTAAVVLEPIQGEGGIHPAPPGYLARAREIAHAAGALVIFDEIQTGFRTGTWFACQHAGVTPDLMALSKGLANGVPIGATLMTAEVAGALEGGVHGTTFGGNPLAAAAGLATLEALESEGWLAHSAEVGAYFIEQLRALAHPKVREVRGQGLMIGVELKGRATPVVRAMQERGVLALMAGSLTVRFLPPLLLTREQVDTAVAVFAEALG
ncbi:aspartate aminotransferase family protein [Sphaerobacter thermophilus]|uniref:Acetylornithine and succinylornithine aminotransferase n=1 Tax=Sphaerobacter thermophilus (strain ATCC 49802 / DSM 20745 / KCCM 41009 / NCIMB 13125 / S 6022) TaxID=479434 RepID=D1C6C0_SPHTD|nr:aspartate aminotransferase family protein [Sphaerobacter thermophilus]ACZ37658.1 acetylornithine and succinylornithine aminotransferase [Sphaerobacter thermophilus DSM 20745]